MEAKGSSRKRAMRRPLLLRLTRSRVVCNIGSEWGTVGMSLVFAGVCGHAPGITGRYEPSAG